MRWIAARGPWVLVAGILAGLTLPGVAQLLVPFIPVMVATLLFLAALRIGPSRMRDALVDMPRTVAIVLGMQLAFPMIALLLFGGSHPFALALLIIAMAPPIAGSPNMVSMIGYDPAVAMRYLMTGTALLPLTVIPILFFVPALGGITEVMAAALRLLYVILVAGSLAFVLRTTIIKNPPPEVIDGLSALLLAVVVIGLMSAVNQSLRETPWIFLGWLGFVVLVNFSLQFIGYFATRGRMSQDSVAALTIDAGNRNVALFLVALPSDVIAPLLVFIGCYQVPMYLTPLITGRLLRERRLTTTK